MIPLGSLVFAVPPPTNHDTMGIDRNNFVVKDGCGGSASDIGLSTNFRAEGIYFSGASMDVAVGVNGSLRFGCDLDRRPLCCGGARPGPGVGASVAVAELAVGLDSMVPDRSSNDPGCPNCAAGIV